MSKYVHSSTKLAALKMSYWRKDLLFLYFRFIVFAIVTLPTGSYMSQVSEQRPVSSYF